MTIIYINKTKERKESSNTEQKKNEKEKNEKIEMMPMLKLYKINTQNFTIINDFMNAEIIENELLSTQLFVNEIKQYIIWFPDDVWSEKSINEISSVCDGYIFTSLKEIVGKEVIVHKKQELKDYSLFNFADLLGEKKFSMAYVQLDTLLVEIKIEEIMGIIMWWIKYMVLIKKQGSTGGLIGDYPEKKMKNMCIKWKTEELDFMHRELLMVYSEEDTLVKKYLFQKLLLSIQ